MPISVIKTFRAVAFAVVLAIPAWSDAFAGPPDPNELVRTVLERGRTTGFRARAKIESFDAVGTPVSSAQILVKGRRDGDRSQTLIAAMWPFSIKGSGVVIDRNSGSEISGFQFGSEGGAEPLGEDFMDRPLFGAGISPGDIAEPFWDWPRQAIAGEEKAGREDCWILESRPRGAGNFPLVRSAISKDKLVAIRIEKFGRDGSPSSTIYFERLAKSGDGGWSPASFSVVSHPGGERTSVIFSRGERDVEVPAGEFAPESFRRYLGSGR